VTGRLEHFGQTGDPRAWVRIANGLLDRIASGELQPHDLAPLVDDLRIDAGLATHQPVTRAFKALEERGVVCRELGIGYRVMPEGAQPAPVPSEVSQVLCLQAFRVRYPQVIIGAISRRAWQACIPEADGETVVTRRKLGDLLDRACELLGEARQPAAIAVTVRPDQALAADIAAT
jgi:hypothetical protein